MTGVQTALRTRALRALVGVARFARSWGASLRSAWDSGFPPSR